jgi:2,3-bisphosphoglycerate-independent phosphoglycerate mutase
MLNACFGSLSPSGSLACATLKDGGCEYFAECLDCIEIEGMKFSCIYDEGVLEIIMEGNELSEAVRPNFPYGSRSVRQILPTAPEGKRTANLLNKFLRKAHSILMKEPDNRYRRLPVNVVLVKEIVGILDA